jgi:hypothetical protein
VLAVNEGGPGLVHAQLDLALVEQVRVQLPL